MHRAPPLNGVELWDLEPTWDTIQALFHRVWGHSADLAYSKDEWSALQRLLYERRRRDRTR